MPAPVPPEGRCSLSYARLRILVRSHTLHGDRALGRAVDVLARELHPGLRDGGARARREARQRIATEVRSAVRWFQHHPSERAPSEALWASVYSGTVWGLAEALHKAGVSSEVF